MLVVSVPRPGAASLAIDQQAIEAVTNPAGNTRQAIRLRGQVFCTEDQVRPVAVALDVRPRVLAFQPDHPIAGDLVIAADLTAGQRTFRADTHGVAGVQREIGKRIVEVFTSPAVTGV